jgi:hydrogenase-4 component B
MLLWLGSATGLLVASAVVAALFGRSDRAALVVGTGGAVAACALGVFASCRALILDLPGESLRIAWAAPIREIRVGVDPLSSFFALCVFLVSGLAAVYGAGSLRSYVGVRRLAPAVVFFNLLVAAMAAVVVARDGLSFLVAWEIMTIASFFLVTFEDEREDVRRAGLTYLAASQLGVVFLLVLFVLLRSHAGSFAFDALADAGPPGAGLASLCFVLALVGFGTKAGFWPLHLWLPEAHPAAPSHVSAMMSGVMIKMGIYGLLRVILHLGEPPVWWGIVLLGVGVTSGLGGVLLALAQHDLKRLLAYHSVENIGIIALGLGIGLLGRSHGSEAMATAGFAGALLHVLNHGLFKGLLFQGAGSVLHATGTRMIDRLGGLGRPMPVTAACFLVGAVAISGLPPLNGFVSEWLIYVGAFGASGGLPIGSQAAAIAVAPALALIGGLAAACFVKAYGVVFLGAPRDESIGAPRHDVGLIMRIAMLAGAAACIGIGLWPAGAVRLIAPAVASVSGGPGPSPAVLGALPHLTRVALALVGAILVLVLSRWLLLRGRQVRTAPTWGCGYAAPTPRMQYTASSYAQPLLLPFAAVLPRHLERRGPDGPFPAEARYEEHLSDLAGERLLAPASRRLLGALGRVRALQQGRVQLYLVYVLVTLVTLLVWQVGTP